MHFYLSLNHVEEETSKTGQYNINKHVSINILITLNLTKVTETLKNLFLINS